MTTNLIKPKALKKGDRVAIVSLSRGILGEDFCRHYIDIGSRRLREMGLEPVFMPNALRGIDYLFNHPEARADDLRQAFADDSISGIICAIGGDDGYRLYPHLMNDSGFAESVRKNPKIFTGFSDTTSHHLMLRRLGLATFYGPNFISDLCELDTEMLPYTRNAFKAFIGEAPAAITSAPIWYEERTDFSPASIGVPRSSHKETHGYELLQGSGVFEGRLLGGCLESFYGFLAGSKIYPDEVSTCAEFNVIPDAEEFRGCILFIETCEEKPSPEVLRAELHALDGRGIFDTVNGVIIGKPQDEAYYEEYKAIYRECIGRDLPILYNINFGHAYPHCVLQYGLNVRVNAAEQTITPLESMFS